MSVTAIDYFYYGRIVCASWNIFVYNAIGNTEEGSDGGTGDDLYGIDDWKFYVKNLLLNFNLIFGLALAMPVALLLSWVKSESTMVTAPSTSAAAVARKKKTKKKKKSPTPTPAAGADVYFSLFAPAILWLLLVFSRPHKEERFLFPVYPTICLAAAISLTRTRQFIKNIGVIRSVGGGLIGLALVVTAVLSASR